MIDKTYKLFIGKDIDRTAALASGNESFATVTANIAEGEIMVLDKNLSALANAEAYSDTEIIYIAQGTSTVLNYEDEAGTSLTGRQVLLSDAINGKAIRKVTYSPYKAKSEGSATISAITGTIVAGTEYVLRIVYKDMEEHPGQFTQTYRYIAKAGDNSTNIFNGIRERIRKHAGTRVIASGTATLDIAAKAVPASTSSLNNIDEFKMVVFDLFLNYVDNDGNWVAAPCNITRTPAVAGSGNWEQVRDLEKFELGYRGVTNRTKFPVEQPDLRTEKGGNYDILIIEYDTAYRSPEESYEKFTSKRAIVALRTPASVINTSAQYYLTFSRLGTWLASTPAGSDFVAPVAPTTIDATAISGLTAPVTGATPVSTITAGTGYTGTVTWKTTVGGTPLEGVFVASTAYTATVTIVPAAGYTLVGVAKDQFTFAGSATDANDANSGVCTVTFAATQA